VIHLAGPVVLAAALAGAGVYGLVARRSAVLVLIGAELLLNAVNVLAVTASTLPPGGLSALVGSSGAAATVAATSGTAGAVGAAAATPADPMLPGQVLAIVVITIAAAEIGLALAVILLVFRQRATSDLSVLRELGEASPSYDEAPDAGELPDPGTAPRSISSDPPVAAGRPSGETTS
jgi:NADH-quinone oxidoreductase subunit K